MDEKRSTDMEAFLKWDSRQQERYDFREEIIAFPADDPVERHFIYQAVGIAQEGPGKTTDPEAYQAAYRIYKNQSMRDDSLGAEADNSQCLQDLFFLLFGETVRLAGLKECVSISCDTMNSINTTLDQLLLPHNEELGIGAPVSKRKSVKAFATHREAVEGVIPEDVREFLGAAYTLGNFIPVPVGCNGPRGLGLTQDYWDLALWCIRRWYLSTGTERRDVYLELLLSGKYDKDQGTQAYQWQQNGRVRRYRGWLAAFGDGEAGWRAFTAAFFMRPFLTGDGSPLPLWEGHLQGFEAFTADVVRGGALTWAALGQLQGKLEPLLPKGEQISEFAANGAQGIRARSGLMVQALAK